MKLKDFLTDYGLPIGAAFLAPELGISSALGAGLMGGGIETIRSRNLGRGLTAGLLAGGASGILQGLPGGAGGAEQLAGPMEEAASGSLMDRAGAASLGDWGSAAFPKGAGWMASPGLYAGLGAVGTMSRNANDEAMQAYQQRLRAQEEARMASMMGKTPTRATPYPSFNYMDPNDYLYHGRGGTPFTSAGFADGGEVKEERQRTKATKPDFHPTDYNRILGIPELRPNMDLGSVAGRDSIALHDWEKRQLQNPLEALGHVWGLDLFPSPMWGVRYDRNVPMEHKQRMEGNATERWNHWNGEKTRINNYRGDEQFEKGGEVKPKGGDPEQWDRLKYAVGRYYDYFDPNVQQLQYSGTAAHMMRPFRDPRFIGDEFIDETDREWGADEKLQRMIDAQEAMPRTRMASGGLASIPGTPQEIAHRRSGAAMLRRIYPDRQSLLEDLGNPDSNAAKMGIRRADDPLIDAAFPANQDGALVAGPGDGRSDSVPAVIDGRQPASLSSGEFVVPAHAVAALGRGSTHAGARKLQMMVDRVKRPQSPRLPV